MKSFKLISLAIAILFCMVTRAQEKTSNNNIQKIKPDTTIASRKPVLIRLGHPTDDKNVPLFVVDGKMMEYSEFKKIKSESIESITILKDSAAIEFCNGRRNNGVIIVKTKKYSKRELRKMRKKDS